MVADVQPNATTSSSMLGRIRSTLGAIFRAYGAQRFGSDVMVVEDTGLVECNAGLAHEDAKLVLHEAGWSPEQQGRSRRAPRPPPSSSDSTTPRSIGPDSAVCGGGFR